MDGARSFDKGVVIQFNENHKWRGCLGLIVEAKTICAGDRYDEKYMVAVEVPNQGTAYIYVMLSEKAIEWIGKAVLMPQDCVDEGEEE